mmetsp:Transcript_57713/g.141569  ORF Transcript_57713/g.141569 Transcript_57713/m.141569 type:complete len:263 (-) Transcript_57713:372-1160(-)
MPVAAIARAEPDERNTSQIMCSSLCFLSSSRHHTVSHSRSIRRHTDALSSMASDERTERKRNAARVSVSTRTRTSSRVSSASTSFSPECAYGSSPVLSSPSIEKASPCGVPNTRRITPSSLCMRLRSALEPDARPVRHSRAMGHECANLRSSRSPRHRSVMLSLSRAGTHSAEIERERSMVRALRNRSCSSSFSGCAAFSSKSSKILAMMATPPARRIRTLYSSPLNEKAHSTSSACARCAIPIPVVTSFTVLVRWRSASMM